LTSLKFNLENLFSNLYHLTKKPNLTIFIHPHERPVHKIALWLVFAAVKISLAYKFIRVASFNKPSLKLGAFLSQCSAIFLPKQSKSWAVFEIWL